MPRRHALTALLLATLAAAVVPPPASAGEYGVVACHPSIADVNNSWVPSSSGPNMPAYAACPSNDIREWNRGLVARYTISSNPKATVPGFSYSKFTFRAPPGASLARMTYSHTFCGGSDFRAGLITSNAEWLHYSGPGCGSLFPSPWSLNLRGITEVNLLLICAKSACQVGPQLYAWATIRNVIVYVQDYTAPGIAITGGSITGGGWQRGTQTLSVATGDNVGVKEVQAFLGGRLADLVRGACNFTLVVPCSTPSPTFTVNTTAADDGPQQVLVRAQDAADNWGQWVGTIYVDNTAPTTPRAPAVDGTAAWRATNDFSIAWKNPPQTGTAPIAGVQYAICPASTPADTWVGCTTAEKRAPNIESLALRVPKAGDWLLRLWLIDAAGNADRRSAAELHVRLDDVPPEVGITDQDPQDPQRVSVAARDSESGIVAGDIELRRQGNAAWIALPLTVSPSGLTAVIDDAALPDGIYDLRARVVDGAGNERSTTTRTSGATAHLSLPLRVPTTLIAGGVRSRRGRDGHRRQILVRTATARYGEAVTVRGRLATAGDNPLAGTDVEILERTSLPDQPWVLVGIAKTNDDGLFSYKALRGPSRTILLRYAGTRLIRPHTAAVELRVRAATSLDVNRRAVVNGDEVVFRGRVAGGPVPTPGKLVQLQAYSRGSWRTFATPRASARTRRWAYHYRFTATRGTVRYRFRAFVPKEGGFPFEPGASRRVKVSVRGL